MFLGLFLYVRACCRESTASTAQHSAVSPAQSHNATTQASRHSWLQPACRRTLMQLAVLSRRTKKSKSARPTKNYNNSQSSLAGVMREGFAFHSKLEDVTLFFLSVVSSSYMHPSSGLLPSIMKLLALASRHFARTYGPMPASLTLFSSILSLLAVSYTHLTLPTIYSV